MHFAKHQHRRPIDIAPLPESPRLIEQPFVLVRRRLRHGDRIDRLFLNEWRGQCKAN
jgi:hypothetical protein